MKVRTDVVKMYKEIHGWVGIVSGLALFIAFYAGAITMFEPQLQRWASPPSSMAPPPSLDDTPTLIAKVLAAHPEAAEGLKVNLVVDSANPARVSWTPASGGDDDHDGTQHFAALAPNGALQVETEAPSPVAEFIDVLHQQVGLPFAHEVAMPIMGAIALLYFVAIVSGLIVLLPSLVSDLFVVRIGKNVKRMWLDAHNLLGVFSLPFHIIMALTAVVFAFHDQFYGAQELAFGSAERAERPAAVAPASPPVPLAPARIVATLADKAPGFTPFALDYQQKPDGTTQVRVTGGDPRHGLRGATFGIVNLDAATGEITGQDYMPGLQDGWSATITSFFALHFGNYGGAPIRWSYFLLGLAGAFLFYTGNLLWVESRRKRERKAGAVNQTRATRILGTLTVGVPIGCMAGISVTLAAAKFLGGNATEAAHSMIYYAVFLICVGWSLWRGAARSGRELPLAAALAMFMIPAASLFAGTAWYDSPGLLLVDATAVMMCGTLLAIARAASQRAGDGPTDSVWSRNSSIRLANPGS